MIFAKRGKNPKTHGTRVDAASPYALRIRIAMTEPDPSPFLLLTVVLDAGARPAAQTMGHGAALERAMMASAGKEVAGLDLVELPIQAVAFAALRRHLKLPDDQVGLYDVFPVASHLDKEVRNVAGQFLAADALWTLESQGLLGGVPLNVKLELPKGWDRDPKAVHARLVEAGAVDLSPAGIETFLGVKTAWDAAQ